MRVLALCAVVSLTAFGHVQAQEALTAARAEAIISGCKAHASAKRQSHAIAVLDAGGDPVATLRMDGNRSGILAFAEAKAKAVTSWGFATARMAESARTTPGFASAPFVVVTPGGVPIFAPAGGAFLGAVGVSGEAPTDDAACAEAGIRAAGLLAERRPG